jgi:hypothetical protein
VRESLPPARWLLIGAEEGAARGRRSQLLGNSPHYSQCVTARSKGNGAELFDHR